MDQFIQKLAIDAGKIVLSKFRAIRSIKIKAHRKDLVTAADFAANNYIIRTIKARFPDHGIITEEKVSKDAIDKGYVWIADPLDGTTGFVHGIPMFCTAIALLKDGVPILSAVYDPSHNELFFAKKGHGAYINGKRMKPTVRTKLWDCAGLFLFTYKIPYTERVRLALAAYKTFFENEINFTRVPSITMDACYVAAGRLDLMFTRDFAIWDLVPGYLIMKEAGVTVTNFKGQPWTVNDEGFIAARPVIYKQLYPKLKKALKL